MRGSHGFLSLTHRIGLTKKMLVPSIGYTRMSLTMSENEDAKVLHDLDEALWLARELHAAGLRIVVTAVSPGKYLVTGFIPTHV